MPYPLINLTPPDVLLVRGPAHVVCEGRVSVLGVDASRKEVYVLAWKVLPFEPEEGSEAGIRFGRGGSCRIVSKGRAGVSLWKDVVSTVIRHSPSSVMLVGATDTGKSTLATYLSNIAVGDGLKVGIVDGDVGQGDLAPPGCMGAVVVKEQFLDLRDLPADYYSFIGSTSPRGLEDLVIRSMKDLMKKLPTTDICIINTDGYMDEHGIDYKIALIKTLKPDLIVYLGNPLKVKRLFDEFKDMIVHADAPTPVSRTRYEREKRRMHQYGRFVDNGYKLTFRIRNKKFVLAGRLHQMILMNGLIQLGLTKLPTRFLNGMFVGLSSADSVRGFGIIGRVGYGRITVKTRYVGDFDTVLLSTVRLSQGMRRECRIPLVMNMRERSE